MRRAAYVAAKGAAPVLVLRSPSPSRSRSKAPWWTFYPRSVYVLGPLTEKCRFLFSFFLGQNALCSPAAASALGTPGSRAPVNCRAVTRTRRSRSLRPPRDRPVRQRPVPFLAHFFTQKKQVDLAVSTRRLAQRWFCYSVRHARRGADPGHPEARFYPSMVSMRALLDEEGRFLLELVF